MQGMVTKSGLPDELKRYWRTLKKTGDLVFTHGLNSSAVRGQPEEIRRQH
jgi:hypothetical protein